jgi:hypothetical protein
VNPQLFVKQSNLYFQEQQPEKQVEYLRAGKRSFISIGNNYNQMEQILGPVCKFRKLDLRDFQRSGATGSRQDRQNPGKAGQQRKTCKQDAADPGDVQWFVSSVPKTKTQKVQRLPYRPGRWGLFQRDR